MGFTHQDLSSQRLQIFIEKGSQRIRVERVGKNLTFSVNGKPVMWKPNVSYFKHYSGGDEADVGQVSYLFITVDFGKKCSIQQFEIDASTEEFGFNAGAETFR